MVSKGEMFESASNPRGNLAGVFEYDGQTGYFYLHELKGEILGAIHVLSRIPDFCAADVAIRWDRSGLQVGLFIRGVLWAAFDADRKALGGNYLPGSAPSVPAKVALAFRTQD
jgi:hypothetical protein